MSAKSSSDPDLPPIELSTDPISEIPEEALILLGEIMAWSTHIEAGLFTLYLLASGGDQIERRRTFYEKAKGLKRRIRLVREAWHGRLPEELGAALDAALTGCTALAELRNRWAHNPLLRYGETRELVQWEIGAGDFAGTIRKIDVPALRASLRDLHQLHVSVLNVSALVNDPSGRSHGFVFGERTPELEAKLQAALQERSDR